MPDAIPPWKFAPEEVPWARWAQERITALERAVTLLSQFTNNENATTGGAIKVLGQNIVDLDVRVQEAFDNVQLDMSQVPTGDLDQSRVAGTWSKGVSTTSPLYTSSSVQFDGGINSVDVYTRLITGSGSFRATSTNILGQMGQTVSSRRFKQDIHTAKISRETLRALRIVFFRYIANIPFDQSGQPWLLGMIAEEVDELGLTWLVIYDDDGRPEALVEFALPYLGLLLAQYNSDELDEVRGQNADLVKRVEALEAAA